jgi:cysteine desulfurase
MAIKGSYFAQSHKDAHIITTAVEHPAVLSPCRFVERLGGTVTYLPVDRAGRVDPGDVCRAITSRTILISVMHANNEVGTIQPIEEIGTLAREHRIRFHTDAAQSIGKIPTKVDDLHVDLLTIAGHKLYAPKGVGALYIRHGLELEPLIHGGVQELGRRAGTESVLLAVGLGAACVLAQDLEPMERIQSLRDRLWNTLRERFGDHVVLNGHTTHRLPNTLNVSFAGKIGAEVLSLLEGVAASTGSACHSGRIELSPVLAAMGVSEGIGLGAIRFSLGRYTTSREIDDVVVRLERIVSVLVD